MSAADESLLKAIRHYQESLDKYTEVQNDFKVLQYIEKLRKLPIQVYHLEQTGVGRTVNGLRKFGGPVSEAAKSLVAKWKEMVVEEQEDEEDDDDEDDVDDGYSEDLLGLPKSPDNESDQGVGDSKSDETDRDSPTPVPQESKSKERPSHRHSDNDKTVDRSKTPKNDALKTLNDQKDPVKSEKIQKHKHHKHNGHTSSSRKHTSHSNRKRNSDASDSEEESKPEKRLKKNEYSEDDVKVKSCREESKDGHKVRRCISNDSDDELKSKDKKKSKSRSDSDNEPKEAKKKHKSDGKSKRSHESDVESKKIKLESSHRKDRHKAEESSKKDDVKRHEHKKVKESDRKDKRKDLKLKEESKKSSSNKGEKKSFKSKSEPIHGIDSGSGASFAEALGMCEPSSSKSSPKKKYSVPEKLTKEKIATRSEDSIPKLPKDLAVDALDINVSNVLWPAISTNYRPLGNSLMSDGAPKKVLSDYEQLSNIISSKNQRTKVYSGNKTAGGSVPSLFETCIRILQDNIDALEYTGGVPYAILKPVLDKANPNQLFMLEHHNPYLIEDTDELWQIHCQKEFRNKKCQELESWREMYMRCLDEREAKLKALTANIKQSQDKSLPVRTTKLAYVDDIAKPPRNIARKQAKNGTGCEKKPAMTPSARLSSLATAGEAGKVAVPNPGARAAERSSHHATVKPKKAPLMAKTLSLLKNRYFKR